MTTMINEIQNTDALSGLKLLDDESIDCSITSPPYFGLRDYKTEGIIWGSKDCEHDFQTIRVQAPNSSGHPSAEFGTRKGVEIWQGSSDYKDRAHYSQFCLKCNAWKGQLGLEPTFDMYIDHLMEIFNEVKRVLKKSGSCWVVIGDTYNGSKNGNTQGTGKSGLHGNNTGKYLEEKVESKKAVRGISDKSLLLIPERFAMKMLDNGWILRNKIIWHKNNCMPSSAKDRFTIDFEFIYFFVKSQRYYFKTQYEPYSETTLKEFGQVYNGKGIKDYADHGVQNPSDVKRRIITSMSKYIVDPNATIALDYKTKIEKRAKSRELAKLYYPGNRKAQAEFIRLVHERGGHIMKKKLPAIGGVKNVGRDLRIADLTYSGNIWNPAQYGRIKRAVWHVNTKPFKEAHFAVFPEELVRSIIDPGCPDNGVVLDPFMGAGTVALVALKMNRSFIGFDLNKQYVEMANKRINPYLYQMKIDIGIE